MWRSSRRNSPLASAGCALTIRIVVPTAPVITAAAASAASALELVDLFVQRVEFLLGQLTFALGLLDRGQSSVQIAHD
jgi:hypothetical protein